MKKRKLHKKKIFLLLLLILVLCAGILMWKYFKTGVKINRTDIQKINVKMEGIFPRDYLKQPVIEFSVENKKNIERIVDTLENNSKGNKERYAEYIDAALKYSITIHNSNGNSHEYSLQGYDTKNNNSFSDVMNSEEVLKQVRTVFHIDLEKVNKLVFYRWEDVESEEAVKEEIVYNKDTLAQLVEIMKQEVLKEPSKTNITTLSGILLQDQNDETLLCINLSKEMAYYNEIVELFPELRDYIQ